MTHSTTMVECAASAAFIYARPRRRLDRTGVAMYNKPFSPLGGTSWAVHMGDHGKSVAADVVTAGDAVPLPELRHYCENQHHIIVEVRAQSMRGHSPPHRRCPPRL